MYSLSAVTIHNKIYFAGGVTYTGFQNVFISRRIDIYDNTTNTWSEDSLYEAKQNMACIAVGDKIYWAGGYTGNPDNGTGAGTDHTSCVVEIRNVNSGKSEIQYLSKRTRYPVNSAFLKDNKIIFWKSFGDENDKFDIYDITTNSWSIGVLPVNIINAQMFGVNNTIYIAGGSLNGVLSTQVYRLEF